MSEKRLLDVQPDGIVEWLHFDDATGRFAIERIQDVDPVLDSNKEKVNHSSGYSSSRELREVAEIPMVIVLKWRDELGIDVFNKDHWPAVKRLLRDADWMHLRSSPGRI